MRIIDAHLHLFDEPGYLDTLLGTMDRLGIEKVCLSGLGKLFGMADNQAVRKAFTDHPDRIIGQVYVRPGVDGGQTIDQGFEQGFRMVKVHVPKKAYDEEEYDELWRRADQHNMPILFHTGIVNTGQELPDEGISSWFMHPMRLERISRKFPRLKMIAAHLGVSWNIDAAELARMRPNIFVDLTGAPQGWRRRADAVGMDQYLWWPDAFNKVIFGTDVHYRDMEQILREDMQRFDRLNIDAPTRLRVLAGNIAELLNLES